MTNGDIAMELLTALGRFKVVWPEMQESTTLSSAQLGAACCVCRWLGHHEAQDARARQYGAQHTVCAAYNTAGVK